MNAVIAEHIGDLPYIADIPIRIKMSAVSINPTEWRVLIPPGIY